MSRRQFQRGEAVCGRLRIMWFAIEFELFPFPHAHVNLSNRRRRRCRFALFNGNGRSGLRVSGLRCYRRRNRRWRLGAGALCWLRLAAAAAEQHTAGNNADQYACGDHPRNLIAPPVCRGRRLFFLFDQRQHGAGFFDRQDVIDTGHRHFNQLGERVD